MNPEDEYDPLDEALTTIDRLKSQLFTLRFKHEALEKSFKLLTDRYRTALDRIANEGSPDFDADDMADCASEALGIKANP